YSQAFDLENYISPAYDNGQDIYNDLLLQLDSAAILFAGIEEIAPSTRSADVMFGANLTMWRKLANTQRLKLLLRQSELFGSSAPTAELAKITSDGSGFLMAGETAEVNPGYAVDQYKQNPFYNTYKTDENGILVDNFNRANNYVLGKYM